MNKTTKLIFLFSVASLVLFGVFGLAEANVCFYHSYQQCSGNYLYWYDSCGNIQDSQYCPNGCYNNSCLNYNNYNNCTYHAYRDCVGNSIYWYDSCGTRQDLYQYCTGTNQICQYGQCVFQQPYVPPYTAHYRTACYGSDIYWYDSLGKINGLYKTCADTNSCTADLCSKGKCSNTLKCDGSTCAAGSADYNSYCAPNHCGNGTCEPALGEDSGNCSNDCKTTPNVSGLSVSFFAKQDASADQWQKTVQVGLNGQVYFMISAANNGSLEINNVNISASIPGEVYSLGNLKVDDVQVSGDIVSGINIGTLPSMATKLITFEGRTQTFSEQATKQATATINVSGATQSDSISINLNPSQAAGASISSASQTSDFWQFIKRWYLWILVGLVLIFLFIVVFRRLSSNA